MKLADLLVYWNNSIVVLLLFAMGVKNLNMRIKIWKFKMAA